MKNINLSNIHEIPIEQLASLDTDKLIKLANEAEVASREANSVSEWINGVIELKQAIKLNIDNKNNQSINYGGENEQITDY